MGKKRKVFRDKERLNEEMEREVYKEYPPDILA